MLAAGDDRGVRRAAARRRRRVAAAPPPRPCELAPADRPDVSAGGGTRRRARSAGGCRSRWRPSSATTSSVSTFIGPAMSRCAHGMSPTNSDEEDRRGDRARRRARRRSSCRRRRSRAACGSAPWRAAAATPARRRAADGRATWSTSAWSLPSSPAIVGAEGDERTRR